MLRHETEARAIIAANAINPAALFQTWQNGSRHYEAFETFIYEDPIEDADNKYLLIGFDINGNLVEVMYNKIDDDSINVFHAMSCRKEYREMV